ncbi:Hypothetical protein D9617_11g009100 [Elsinoe fawcettii]|nr:Hypothetical protein D9617_11g009100 [Elsinoe fawcettii]
MAHLHVADLDRKRQSRNVKKIRTHSPASSTGTFFDDDQSGETQSLNTSWSGSTRADSAMSSHSDERKTSEQRSHMFEVKPTAALPSAPQSQEWSKGSRASTRLDMWPPALRIMKSPTFEDPRPSPMPPGMLPSTVYEAPTPTTRSPIKYSPSSYSPSSESVMGRPRPKMHRRLESAVQDDSSSSSSRNSDQSIYSTLPDSAVSFGDAWTSKSSAAKAKTPGNLNSLAAMGSAPRESRHIQRRSRATPLSPRLPITGTTTDWTAVAPSPRHRPEPLAKMPTPPISPSHSITDMYGSEMESADIVIGRRVTVKGRDRSSSVPESAMSPKSPVFNEMAFPSPPRDSSRNTRIHCPASPRDEDLISPCTVLQKELPPHPYTKRRSLSADEAGKRAKTIERIETETANKYRVMHSTQNSVSTTSLGRPDRVTMLTETLREMNARSAGHYERYTKLRQGRQCLHSEILAVLQSTTNRSKSGKSPLQLQIEIATMDAGIDDCMSKLSTLEKKRTKLMEELLSLTIMRSPGSMHSRNESLGIQEIIQTPGSPPIGGMAAMMANFSFDDKYSQKSLPKIPRREVMSQASLSLANVMDFLDTDDQDGY